MHAAARFADKPCRLPVDVVDVARLFRVVTGYQQAFSAELVFTSLTLLMHIMGCAVLLVEQSSLCYRALSP